MEKSEKSFEPFLRKLRYQPTNQLSNQPTNQLLPTTPILWDLTDAGSKKYVYFHYLHLRS